MDKVKEHLDKIIAALIILACVVAVAARLLSGSGQAANSTAVEQAISSVDRAIKENRATAQTFPDWVSFMARKMGETERPVSETRVAWAFYPTPPDDGIVVIDPGILVAEVKGALSPCSITLVNTWVGKAQVKVSFGAEDKLWRARALQVWRKSAAEKDWPAEPLLTIKLTVEGGKTLPPGVTALGDGAFDFFVEDIKAREPYEYRVRAAASFPKVEYEFVVDAKKYKFTGVDGAKPLETPGSLGALLLGGEIYATEYSAPVAVELPGNVQVKLGVIVKDETGEQASIGFQQWMASEKGWVKSLPHFFTKGQDLKCQDTVRLKAGAKKVIFDPQLQLIDIKEEVREVEYTVDIPYWDPKDKVMKTRQEKRKRPALPVKIAVVKDKISGKTGELEQGGDWWPKGLTVPPEVIERPAPDKKEKPPAGGPAKAPVPEKGPPTVAPPTATPPTPPPGEEPGVYEIRGMKIDLKKPMPPDASPELRQAYEDARKLFEEKQKLVEPGLR